MLGEAQWLASQGVTELVLVSENSTSYGKDLGDLRSLEKLLPQLAAIEGLVRVRVAYLQPAELRPGLLEVIAGRGGHGAVIAPYFDLSFQHSSPTLLRRMRRFGGTDDFLALIERARSLAPQAGFRTNVILGFPGETDDDVAELERFLTEGRLDAVGVFGYSDEEGTEGARLTGKLDQAEIDARVRRITDLVEELTAQRAEDRIGERVEVLLTEDLAATDGPGVWLGHAAHQDPDADGTTTVAGVPAGRRRRLPRHRGGRRHRGRGPGRPRARSRGRTGRAVTARDRRCPGPGRDTPAVGQAGQPAERADRAPARRRPAVRGRCCCRTPVSTTPAATGPRWCSSSRSSPTATTG